jgi:serine/threonine protein kinase
VGLFDAFKDNFAAKLPKEVPFSHEVTHVADMLSGAMSTIARVKHKSGKIYCVKKVTPRNPQAKAKLQRELEISFQLQHENVVKVISWEKKGEAYWILMELIDGASLRAFLRDQFVHKKAKAPVVNGRDLVTVFVQCARALQYVHGKGFLHLDVKPENFLTPGLTAISETKIDRSKETGIWKKEVLQQSKGITVKLIDFGVSMKISEPKTNVGGSILYVAPEVVTGAQTQSQIGPGSDIWSLGATMYELATGRPPFLPGWFDARPQHWQALWGEYDQQDASLKRAYESDMLKKRLSTPPDMAKVAFSDAIRGIIRKCLEVPMSKRYLSSAALVSELEKFL